MKLVRPRRHYPNIEAFYRDRPEDERRYSGEVDFGVLWTSSKRAGYGDTHRVSLVSHTGELYVVRETDFENVNKGTDRVRVVATFDDRAEAEWALEDWGEHCGPGGLSWLFRRLEICVPKFVCGRHYQFAEAEFTFDPTQPCPRCGHMAWNLDPAHERERRQRSIGASA